MEFALEQAYSVLLNDGIVIRCRCATILSVFFLFWPSNIFVLLRCPISRVSEVAFHKRLRKFFLLEIYSSSYDFLSTIFLKKDVLECHLNALPHIITCSLFHWIYLTQSDLLSWANHTVSFCCAMEGLIIAWESQREKVSRQQKKTEKEEESWLYESFRDVRSGNPHLQMFWHISARSVQDESSGEIYNFS